MDKIFKKVALVIFISIMATSYQSMAQRHGGGGHGGGFGGGHSMGHSGGFGGHSGGFGGGHSARPFAPRPSGGFNRPAHTNTFNRPSPTVRSYSHTTVRPGGFNRTTVHSGFGRPVNSYHRTTVVNHTTVINRGYVRGGYYGHPTHISYYHPVRPVYVFGHPHYGYYYHPYRPYYWGPTWHPIGFFTGALIGAAIELSWNNHPYRYYNGVYYEPYNSGYRVIAPPVGIRINALPPGFSEIPVDGVNYYYYGGTFYRNYGNEYAVVAAPFGAVVYQLPDGAQEVTVNGNRYMFYNNTYFQPFNDNGNDAYEVVDVRER